ncbi:MAG TPA: aminodeoxychorismate/anthranilate synthase component II [Patescibacteria group bacterium]|nr:aminodeoxychorismate/anthranilate synthase component II [Patescibacteria group bacterium]
MIVMIDNYDSFTYNLYQYVASLGQEMTVVRNDAATADDIAAMNCRGIIISPGPGTPDEAGISREVVEKLGKTVPVLGVCLGHQVIGELFGCRVIRAAEPVHGKTSRIKHDGSGLYQGLPQSFVAGRYHSLIIDPASLPECLETTAITAEGEIIMGVRHKQYPIEGVQFHPESVLTADGMKLLKNFVCRCG